MLKHCVLFIFAVALTSLAETGHEAWLRYAFVPSVVPYEQVVFVGKSKVIATANAELARGFRGMLRRRLETASRVSRPAIVLGTTADLKRDFPEIAAPDGLQPDGYWLKSYALSGQRALVVGASNERGVLYGVFALLRRISLQQPLDSLDTMENPSAPIRWTNEWDNLDGSIERGYGGRSIFFADGDVATDLTRVKEYARLLASVGINGCTINNVNASPRMLASDFIPRWAKIADVFRPWGVRLSIAVDLSSPQKIGGLKSFDPLDSEVAEWWRAKADEIYRVVPDFAGFLVKADSEGRLGPSSYGRTHADAANLLARALQPHGGILIYRAFVYNHRLDWNDLKADRAKAAYDNFAPLDGKFDDNVVVQIKYGPIDFQVREPVSPLIGALHRTNQALELQITQEYTGQQRHVCFLAPMWKEILDFDLHSDEKKSPVKTISSGRDFRRPIGGFIGVSNVGLDENWLGSDFAQANLYAFGRLAWNPDFSAKDLAEEWARLTFGNDPLVAATIVKLQMESWLAYEKYTGAPLGLQTLTNIVGPHYGPGPDSADGNGWGQWIRADRNGIGMDRTVTGTGFAGQYSSAAGRNYETLQACPDNLLLFFHHVPYNYVLHSGNTVIQTIYDAHYEGAETAQQFPAAWNLLKGKIDDARYTAVLARLEYQAGHAIVWRDAINEWFFHLTGIADGNGRVGHHPGRIEAESMALSGYEVEEINPWYAASNAKAIECPVASCTATFKLNEPSGKYDIAVQYFDQRNGRAGFRLSAGTNPPANWTAEDSLPSEKADADTSTRHVIRGVTLHRGDEITIQGHRDGGEKAVVDYVEIVPSHD